MLLSLIGWLLLYHVICGSGIPDAGQVKLTVLSLTVSGVSTLPGWSTFGGTYMRRRYSLAKAQKPVSWLKSSKFQNY